MEVDGGPLVARALEKLPQPVGGADRTDGTGTDETARERELSGASRPRDGRHTILDMAAYRGVELGHTPRHHRGANQMPSVPTRFTFTLRDLVKLSGMSYEAVAQGRSRNEYDPANLGSVVVWLSRRGSVRLRRAIVAYGMTRETDDNPWMRTPRRTSPRHKK